MPKTKNRVVQFLVFLCVCVCTCLCVCGCVRAISRKLRNVETWNFAEMFISTYSQNNFFCFAKFWFYTPQPTVYLSHCLFRPKVYSNLLIAHNYVYLNPGIRPKQKIGLISYKTQPTLQPSTHCLFTSLFTYTQRLLKPTDMQEWRLPKPGDLPEK